MSAADAIAGLEGLAGIPRSIPPFSMEATRVELEGAYGVKLQAGAPSWRGRRAEAKAAPAATYILRAPASCSAIIDSQGRCRPVVDGRIAVTGEERLALLANAGWSDS